MEQTATQDLSPAASDAIHLRSIGRAGAGFAFAHRRELPFQYRVAKRSIDLVIATLVLAAALPVIAAVSIAVKLDSPGPIFVRQLRIGKGLNPFHLYKFRSMVLDAEALKGQVESQNDAAWPLFKMRRDPRVTRTGRFLRRFSLDELPQLVNVLRGEMSLVGPRPPLPEELWSDHIRQCSRLRVAPGMTGLWQVSGRSDLDYVQMVALDLEYTRNGSILRDLSILLRTIPVAASGKGAY